MSALQKSYREQERYAVVLYLRGGGTYSGGVWHAWDSETRSYAEAFANAIEAGQHDILAGNRL